MENRFSLEGKTALVTGGSRGLGFGIARGLAEHGADVAITARHPKRLKEAEARLKETSRGVWSFSFDLSEVEAIPRFYKKVCKATGGVDILVNNAGGTRRGPAEKLPLRQWDEVIKLNLTAVFALSKEFAKERIASGRPGKIINIGSLMCECSCPTTAAYTAGKGGIRQLTKALALDWAPYGINVNAIGPGYFATDLTEPLQKDRKFTAWVKKRTPLGRWGRPEDLPGTAVFLASSASDFVTGQIIYVDGGWLATF